MPPAYTKYIAFSLDVLSPDAQHADSIAVSPDVLRTGSIILSSVVRAHIKKPIIPDAQHQESKAPQKPRVKDQLFLSPVLCRAHRICK
jgi:hypothetical protein